MFKTLLRSTLCLLPLLATSTAPAAQVPASDPAAQTDVGRTAAAWHPAPPKELVPITRVVDGDTFYVRRNGVEEKLRLLCVDTEEKLSGRSADPSKPETVFGQETMLWAQQYFKALERDGQPAQVGLLFPDGSEHRDVYGRLLCHLLLPDGTDFNLLLVAEGKSPYFNKYGNSTVCHAAFVAAQSAAQAAQVGIWNPKTNQPQTPGAPAAIRPYAKLLPWWQARAEALDAFQAAHQADPLRMISGEDGAALEAALKRGQEIEVFGSTDQLFEETDGSLTVLLRAEDKSKAVRLRIAKDNRQALLPLALEQRHQDYRQNYFYARGLLRSGARPGFELELVSAGQLRLGGPEPKLP